MWISKYPVLIYIVHGPTISLSQRLQRTHEGKIILAANRWSSMHLGSGFFSFGGEWGVLDFCCSQSVCMKFSLCSHQVPNEFSKTRKEFPTYSYNFLALTIFMGSPHPDSHHHLQHFATTIHFHLFIHDLLPTSVGWVNLLPMGIWQWLVNVFNYPFNFSTQLINIYDLPYLYFTQLTYIWGLPLPKRG